MADSRQASEWAELADAHGAAVWALLRRLCRHEQDAEDAFQETAVRAWRNWSPHAVASPRAWLMTIAYRVFLDQKAREKARPSETLVEAVDFRAAGPAAATVLREEASRAAAAVETLNDEVREVIVLHYAGGLSLREVAAAMGIKSGTVKSRLAAGLGQLRKALV
jgi:RNA polymerase sigma factor (sigma-70 family)